MYVKKTGRVPFQEPCLFDLCEGEQVYPSIAI